MASALLLLPTEERRKETKTMRRLVGISIKSSGAAGLLLVGTIYLAAEARQAALRLYTTEALSVPAKASMDSTASATLTAATPATPIKAQLASKPARPQLPTDDERAAEQQASQLPAPKPSPAPDAHTRQIVISIPDRKLALLEDGELVKIYPIAVGATDTPSPAGEFTVINHAVNPVYRHDGKVIPPGKGNPVGTRWMGLSLKGYGIHGTNVQSSVGKAASHGCFRMKKKDVEELYSKVQIGDTVSVRGERDEMTAGLFTPATKAAPVVAAVKTDVQMASVAAGTPAETQQQ
jgi:lipoprotein-anchoring transpeptidase ErfK/SrfK